jgi:SAM-dependent methyltransferase
MSRAKNYFAWQSRLALREVGQRVVEVGCGIGNFTEMLLDRELVIAVDREETCVELLRGRYRTRENLRAMTCDVSDPAFGDLGRFRPDSCVCLNVLEHVRDDRRALEAMASILTPGGAIVLLVPAFEALFGPIDERLGHFRRYDRAGMAKLAASAGLLTKRAYYLNAIGLLGWWWNAHVGKRESQSDRQIAIFDRWVVPVAWRLEAAVRPPFGQSLVAVLRKP